MSLGTRIKSAREAKKITQAALAARFSISRNAVSMWESGDAQPSAAKVPDIARFLGVSPNWLWTGREERAAKPAAAAFVGYAGARDVVNVPDGDRPSLGDLDAPQITGDEWQAVIVQGRSMTPVYRPGDVLFFRRREHEPTALYGMDCVVETERGRRYIKLVRKGVAKGTVDLESHAQGVETIRDVTLVWAAPIEVVQRGRGR